MTKEQANTLKRLRLTTIFASIVGFLSFFSITVTIFAYGIGDTTWFYLLLYPVFFVAIILIIAKVRLGFYLIFLIALIYALLLTSEVGKYLVFDLRNTSLFFVLLIPYLIFLFLMPLTTIYLTADYKNATLFKFTSIFVAFGIFIFAIADRFDKDYSDQIFIDAEISKQGRITLSCKPGFADTRTFVLTSNAIEFGKQIKKFGEFYQGSYFLQNVVIKKNFRFDDLQSVTLVAIGKNKISPTLTWTIKDIKGDVAFLQP